MHNRMQAAEAASCPKHLSSGKPALLGLSEGRIVEPNDAGLLAVHSEGTR